MTAQLAAPRAGTTATTSTTGALLACGVVAGPVFVAVVVLQMLTRDGYDLRRHPISLLSVGEGGWVQIANFVVAGLLCLALAVGMRRVLHPGRAGTWGPVLVALHGLGLVAGGVFVADPALGFPPGTPPGIPEQVSWHSTVHGFAPVVAFNAVILACLVFVRRFVARRQWGWAAYSAATGIGALALTVPPGMDSLFVRLAIAVTMTFAWLAALSLHLSAELRGRAS